MTGTIIYGNGAMARVLHSYARHTMNIVAFTVDDHCISGSDNRFCGLPLLAFSQVREHFSPTEHSVIVAVGYHQMNTLRELKAAEARAFGFVIGSYIHPGVIRHDDVEFGAGCMILDHVSIHPGSRIGENVFISSNVNIGHDCIIEAGNWINSGVAIAGGSRIGQGCLFGVNASVGHGVSVGSRNFIAANTFVGTDTGRDQVYLSEPGQRLKMRSLDFLSMTQSPAER